VLSHFIAFLSISLPPHASPSLPPTSQCDLNHLRSLLSSILTAMTPTSTCLLKLAKRNLYPVIVVEKEGGEGVDVKGEVRGGDGWSEATAYYL